MKKKKLSIITVCYNSSKTIEKTLLSVLNQEYTDFEYIILDGESQDDTLKIIKRYESKFKEKKIEYKYYSEKDKGIYNAMNKAIKLCCGEYIGIINSDDWYEENIFSNIKEYFDGKNEIIYGLLRYIKNEKYYKVMGNRHEFLNEGMINHPTCFVLKTIYEKIGFYDEKYKSAADYDFMIKANKNSVKFKFLEKIIANFRIGGVSSTILGSREALEIRRKYEFISAIRYIFLLMKLNIKKWLFK